MEWIKFESFDDRETVCKEILDKAKARRGAGAKKYGDNSFFDVDNIESLEEELLDTINYAIFEIIKLRQIRQKIEQIKKIE